MSSWEIPKIDASDSNDRIDWLTVVAVAIAVGFSCCFVHEAIGHAGMAKLLDVRNSNHKSVYKAEGCHA